MLWIANKIFVLLLESCEDTPNAPLKRKAGWGSFCCAFYAFDSKAVNIPLWLLQRVCATLEKAFFMIDNNPTHTDQ